MNPTIKRIILGTKKYKNLVTNGIPVNTDGWITYGGRSVISLVDGWIRGTLSAMKVYFGRNNDFNFPIGDQIYFQLRARGSKSGNFDFYLCGTPSSYASKSSGYQTIAITESDATYSGLMTTVENIASGFSVDGGGFANADDYIETRQVLIIDLTALGLGNKSLAWCNANIPQNIIW